MRRLTKRLSKVETRKLNAYWRATNYLSVGQIYLCDNPFLRRSLKQTDVKKILLGHWGTTPGQNFIYTHLNRVINKYDANMLYISGPGHGGPAVVSNVYLEGTMTEIYPKYSRNDAGAKNLFQEFSFPGGLSSHVSPQIPGSIHEGGELGYSLSHAFGAVFDNPDLITACVVGDGEAETGPLATSWHSNKFLNPITDGAVLPILHLNGYKISNPTILARIGRDELKKLFIGYGWEPLFVEGDDPMRMHEDMAAAMDEAVEKIQWFQRQARKKNDATRPQWPMIILNSPKGWTGPKTVNNKPNEGNFRSHQVPLLVDDDHPENLKLLEEWLKSYHPEELFDETGKLIPELAELVPKDGRRMGANINANGGVLRRELYLPDFRKYAVDVPYPSKGGVGNTHALGPYLRDVIKQNTQYRNFRLFAPDETISNRLEAVFEQDKRQWVNETRRGDEFLAPHGSILDSMLSEHMCQGWLEGYLLTGRHGIFSSYEAFIRIVDSMINQHAKWLKMCAELPWRNDIASLNYLLTSHVWRQDHNGFTHQDPGFIDHLVNKKATVARIYLPPDANTLLSVMDHCLRSRNYINLTICGKHDGPQWLNMEDAVVHATKGISTWDWAGNYTGKDPDVVIAAAGDVPTLESLAAVQILRQNLPKLKIRYVNVIDLMRLQPNIEHSHGLSDVEYDDLFTIDKPIVFAFHGYPWLVHRLTYRRTNRHLHVRGYKEEGTITTAFDMTVLNFMDRYHLVLDVIERTFPDDPKAIKLKLAMEKKLVEHRNYINENGIDMPEIRNWKWELK